MIKTGAHLREIRMIIIIINHPFGTNNGQTKIKDSWNQLKYQAGESGEGVWGGLSILVQVGFGLDIFSVPLGVCCCHSRQRAPAG